MELEQVYRNIQILHESTPETTSELWADDNGNIYSMNFYDKVTFGLSDCCGLSSEKIRKNKLDNAVNATMEAFVIAVATASVVIPVAIATSLADEVETEFTRGYNKLKRNIDNLDAKIQKGFKQLTEKAKNLRDRIKEDTTNLGEKIQKVFSKVAINKKNQ